MTTQRVSTGGPWEASVGYSRAVRRGRAIRVSGTTAIRSDGSMVGEGDAGAQAAEALRVALAAVATAEPAQD